MANLEEYGFKIQNSFNKGLLSNYVHEYSTLIGERHKRVLNIKNFRSTHSKKPSVLTHLPTVGLVSVPNFLLFCNTFPPTFFPAANPCNFWVDCRAFVLPTWSQFPHIQSSTGKLVPSPSKSCFLICIPSHPTRKLY